MRRLPIIGRYEDLGLSLNDQFSVVPHDVRDDGDNGERYDSGRSHEGWGHKPYERILLERD